MRKLSVAAKLWSAVIAVAVAIAGTAVWQVTKPDPKPTSVTPPWEFTMDVWQRALGGDEPLTEASYQELNTFQDTNLTAKDAAAARTVAGAFTIADLTGQDRGQFPGLWPPNKETAPKATYPCQKVDVLAAAPALMPVAGDGQYSKVILAVTGRCGDTDYTSVQPLVTYAYLVLADGAWKPVRDWRVPVNNVNRAETFEPKSWQMSQFTCGSEKALHRDRILVVSAFTAMCNDAKADGVDLLVTSAYRSRAEQQQLFQLAVKQYGSKAEALKWVAYADEQVCESRHCTGIAVNVAPTIEAVDWLTATAGCLDGTQVTISSTCRQGTTALPRMARYGFSAPVAKIPGYLEFTLPIEADAVDPTGQLSPADCYPLATPVPNEVASIFRCRLARAGLTGNAAEQVVEEALAVSRCESDWNSQAYAYAGRYLSVPNPVDNRLYTERGVFMLTPELADAGWVLGGQGGLLDPVANINAAASVYLADRSWRLFGCATGTDGGFEAGPVLPEYGGPTLPAWTSKY